MRILFSGRCGSILVCLRIGLPGTHAGLTPTLWLPSGSFQSGGGTRCTDTWVQPGPCHEWRRFGSVCKHGLQRAILQQ